MNFTITPIFVFHLLNLGTFTPIERSPRFDTMDHCQTALEDYGKKQYGPDAFCWQEKGVMFNFDILLKDEK